VSLLVVVIVADIDTRASTKRLREDGSLIGILTKVGSPLSTLWLLHMFFAKEWQTREYFTFILVNSFRKKVATL